LPSNCIQKNSIAFDTSGNVWVAFWPVIDSLGQLHGGGIAKYNGVSWTTVVQSDTIPNHNIDAIAIDHQNNLWATCYGKILKYDGNTWTEFNHSNSSFTLNGFRSMTVDANNSIWVGSDLFYPHNELIKISNSVLTVYTNLNSNLPSGVISSLSVDANNQLWIGLEAGDTGLSKLSGNTFTSYNINNSGLSTDYVYSVYAKGNKIYLGTEDGLLIYEDNSITGFNLVSTSAKSNLSVYPSPTHNTFSIFLNNEMQNAELKVFDIRGSEVYKQKLKGQSTIINNQFSPGVYFVRVSDGEKSFTQKLIVE
jgi:hypothetical protein